MPRLRSLAFVLQRDEEDEETGEHYDATVIGEKALAPLLIKSSPKLNFLKICGFSDLQEETFRKLKETGVILKLKSLVLDDCPIDAMKDLSEIPFDPPLKHLRLIPYCESMHSPGHIADYALPVAISGFLKKVAKELTTLDFRLKTLFEEELDEDGPDPNQEFPTLPCMPKLRSLTLAALKPGDFNYGFETDNRLELRFDSSLDDDVAWLKTMYPQLIEMRLLNTDDVDLALRMAWSGWPHDGVKRLEIGGLNSIRQDAVNREAAAALPNADIIFL